MAYLIITNGLDQGQLFELSGGENIIGRDEGADIQLCLNAVSRRHAILKVCAETVSIQDLESANGTLLNNNLLKKEAVLQDGDLIKIADMEFKFCKGLLSAHSQVDTIRLNDFRSTAAVETLLARSDLLKQLRQFFYDAEFDEVETPMLSADTVVDRYLYPIGVEVAGQQYWLQTSPEFGMKRLIASGMNSIFQICHAFRDEEKGPLHNLEFTMVEWYRVGDTTEEAIQFLGELATSLLPYYSFETISYQDAFLTILEFDPLKVTEKELIHVIASLDFEAPQNWRALGKDDWLNLLLTEFIQPRLGKQQPCILYDYPVSQSALARIHPENPLVAERFELFIDGIEIANGYHELLDAGELHQRNLKTNALRQLDDRPELPIDSYLAHAMEHGLPDCCGVALGFDRLAMLALGKASIFEVLPFPFPRA
ncbi:MAG: EF-P lysine aminoacylase GenX [Planctomycetaceae bacterium]|nr:EF-P lysine aminoacylase GenX [Planctomycetaceae bacterium]|tara:strand:- start:697 stop:1974 length:1278 start_codon:yes stop_codon:yes gene_type:complete